jgi:hypothetical protein
MTSLMRLPFCSAELLGAPIPRGLLRAKLPFRKSLFLIPPCTQSWYTQFYDPRNSESLSWTTAAGPWRGGCVPSVRSMTKGGGGPNFCLNAPGIAEPLGPNCRVATLGQSLEPPPPPRLPLGRVRATMLHPSGSALSRGPDRTRPGADTPGETRGVCTRVLPGPLGGALLSRGWVQYCGLPAREGWGKGWLGFRRKLVMHCGTEAGVPKLFF